MGYDGRGFAPLINNFSELGALFSTAVCSGLPNRQLKMSVILFENGIFKKDS